MKNLLGLLVLFVLSGLLFSCAPKVVTNVLKSYPPLPEEEEVTVYERENNHPVPAHAETVGNIAVVDNGFAISGSYEKVVGLAADETRKNGGNGLLITDHLKPSFWGSSIHQIAGIMLKVNKNDTLLVSSREAYVSIREEDERKYINTPEHTLMLNTGYSLLEGRTEGLSDEAKRAEDRLSRGITWDAHYYYHHKGLPYGFGLMASQFYSSPFEGGVVYNHMSSHVRLDYAGVSLSWRKAFSPKWLWGIYFGVGYLGVTQKLAMLSNPSNYGTMTGATLGSHLGIGIEHRLSRRIGIGANLSAISGNVSSVKYNNITLDPSVPAIGAKNRLNVSRFNATAGVRYYLK